MGAIKDFFVNMFSTVSENLISGDAYYQILRGMLVTAGIVMAAWLTAAVLGGLISYVMCYEKKAVSVAGRCICFIFRSSPAVLVILLFYYVFFGAGNFNKILIMGIALGLYGAGHLAEILAHAVRKEQEKLSRGVVNKLEKVYYTTVLPQAFQDSLFQIKRLFIQLLQWTAIAGYISLNDLTEVMYGIGQRTMYPFFSIAFAIICYMAATVIIEAVFKLIEKRMK